MDRLSFEESQTGDVTTFLCLNHGYGKDQNLTPSLNYKIVFVLVCSMYPNQTEKNR